MDQPLVAVSTDVRQFDNYTWHAAPQQYLEAAIATAGVLPVLLPPSATGSTSTACSPRSTAS